MRLALVLVLAGCVPDLAAAKKNLRSAVEDKQDELAACYTAGLARDAEAKGSMALVLHVTAAEGHVESVKVGATELSDTKLEKCVKSALTAVEVAPVPAADFDIDYTLQFGDAATDDDEQPAKKQKKPASDD